MRAEHIALHGAGSFGGAQFYIGCAQLAVSGPASVSPSSTVKIPGVYDGNEPGILINIYWPIPTNYTAPGPVTWPNACIDHTANLNGQNSDGDCTGSDASDGDDESSPVPSDAASITSAIVSPTSESTPLTSLDITSPAASAVITIPTSFANSTVPTLSSLIILPTTTGSSCAGRRRRRSHKH